MNRRSRIRRILLGGILLFLLVLAWGAISGGLNQLPRSHTVGRQIETVVQLACGLFSLLTVFTCFWWQRWALPVRAAWGISFVIGAGLSPLVWGPPMPLMALVFAVGALLVVLTTTWAIRRLSGSGGSVTRLPARASGMREGAS